LQNENKEAQAKLMEAEAKLMESESKVTGMHVDQVLKMEQQETSKENHLIDNATKMAELQFKEHEKEISSHQAVLKHTELNHKIKQENKNTVE
jgi:hypothetical protein